MLYLRFFVVSRPQTHIQGYLNVTVLAAIQHRQGGRRSHGRSRLPSCLEYEDMRQNFSGSICHEKEKGMLGVPSIEILVSPENVANIFATLLR